LLSALAIVVFGSRLENMQALQRYQRLELVRQSRLRVPDLGRISKFVNTGSLLLGTDAVSWHYADACGGAKATCRALVFRHGDTHLLFRGITATEGHFTTTDLAVLGSAPLGGNTLELFTTIWCCFVLLGVVAERVISRPSRYPALLSGRRDQHDASRLFLWNTTELLRGAFFLGRRSDSPDVPNRGGMSFLRTLWQQITRFTNGR
jgi:hypothetical protein